MESARSYASTTTQATSFRATAAQIQLGFQQGENQTFSDLFQENKSEELKSDFTYQGISRFTGNIQNVNKTQELEDKRSLESIRSQCVQFLIKWLYESLSGHRKRSEDTGISYEDYYKNMQPKPVQSMGIVSLESSYQYYHMEEENTVFSTQGIVRTSDGREINFNLGLSMSRSFQEYYEENRQQTIMEFTDPLVINLDGNITELSDQKFEFDLDSDGKTESISRLGSGSGYIAWDKNGDGVINDGNELFGTKSGDGFKDLAEYDEDGNGWIDENDAIWDKLLIWTMNEKGENELYHLADKGVGAICLKNASTQFGLNSLENNQANGMIKQTGIFLYENGDVGTMQNIDVAS